MAHSLTPEQEQDLRKAFDLTQDSGVVDQYGAKKMLQIFNMNPTTEDVMQRYAQHNIDASSGLTFDEFVTVFADYLKDKDSVQEVLRKVLAELFVGPVTKTELVKILVEMGAEAFEPEEANDLMRQIPFDREDTISQSGLQDFLQNKVDMSLAPSSRPPAMTTTSNTATSKAEEKPSSPEVAKQPPAEESLEQQQGGN